MLPRQSHLNMASWAVPVRSPRPDNSVCTRIVLGGPSELAFRLLRHGRFHATWLLSHVETARLLDQFGFRWRHRTVLLFHPLRLDLFCAAKARFNVPRRV